MFFIFSLEYFTKQARNWKHLWIMSEVSGWIEFVHKCSGDHWGPWASCSWFNFVKASLAFHLQLILFCKSNHVPDSICMAQVIVEFVCDKVKTSQNILIFFVSPLTFNISLQAILSSRESIWMLSVMLEYNRITILFLYQFILLHKWIMIKSKSKSWTVLI